MYYGNRKWFAITINTLMLTKIQSRNIIINIITNLGQLFILVEYCPFGNLRTYLVTNRSSFVNLVDEFGNMNSFNNEHDATETEDR